MHYADESKGIDIHVAELSVVRLRGAKLINRM